jgi:hypothetical protein
MFRLLLLSLLLSAPVAAFAQQCNPSGSNTIPKITTGGTAVVLVTGPTSSGGWIYNPPTAAAQGIVTAENLNVDPTKPPGAGDANGNGTATAIVPGQVFLIPQLAPQAVIWGNASTSGHLVTVVVCK